MRSILLTAALTLALLAGLGCEKTIHDVGCDPPQPTAAGEKNSSQTMT